MSSLKNLAVIALALISHIVFSQDTVYVYQKVGGILKIPMNNVDSIIFYDTTSIASDTSSSEGEYVICDGSTFTWNDVTNPVTGKTWMDRNLGAKQVATSLTDSLAYGDLYQWGRGSDGHQCRNSDTINLQSNSDSPEHSKFINEPEMVPGEEYIPDWRSPKNDNLWQGVDGINNPCPTGYRLPTKTEWEEEVESWSSKDMYGAYGSVLKLPAAGWRQIYLPYTAVYGYYWSSTPNEIGQSYKIGFQAGWGASYTGRTAGLSIRCIKD